MYNAWFLGAALLAVWSPVAAFAQRPGTTIRLNLARAEQMALSNHPQLARAEANLRLARAKQTQAYHGGILPTLSLRNIYGVLPRLRGVLTETGVLVSPDTSTGLGDLRPFTEVELNIVQPLYTFGRVSQLKRAATYGVQAEEAGLSASRAEVREQVRTLYWGVVLGQTLQRIVEDAQTEVSKAEQTLETKLDEGSDEVSQNDLFKLQLFRYEVDKRHREAEEKVQLAQSALRQAVGLAPTSFLLVEDSTLGRLDFTLDSLSTYIMLSLQSRPDLRRLGAGIAAREALTRSSASAYRPQFFIGAQVKLNHAPNRFDPQNPFLNNPTNFFRPGIVLGLNWNLNFVQTKDRVRVARFEEDALAARWPMAEAGVRLEVERAFLSLQRADQDIRESERALRASNNWLRSAAQTFDLGIGDVKDFIDAFRADGTMRAEHAENIARFNTTLAALGRAVGRDFYPRQ